MWQMPLLVLIGCTWLAAAERVSTLRVPHRGMQPQLIQDETSTLHLVYYRGEPGAGDLFYVKSADDGASFSPPVQVNSSAGSAIAMGNIRGARMALGKANRVHVAWMGSGQAPKGPNNASPMLYARMNDAKSAFEPEKNVMQFAGGLDGGGTLAADADGNVYVFWHGNGPEKGEQYRQVFVARSTDEGKLFAREVPASQQPTGACACCGMSALAANGSVYTLYRAAEGGRTPPDQRGLCLLASNDKGASFRVGGFAPWKAPMCPMSSSALYASGDAVLAAWETQGQVSFGALSKDSLAPAKPINAPDAAKNRKHPALAANKAGEVILVWTEGMGWQKGGSVHWQIFDKSGAPTAVRGSAEGVPANSLPAVFARKDGGFCVVY